MSDETTVPLDATSGRDMLRRALSPPHLTGGAPTGWEAPSPEQVAPLFPGYEVQELIGRGGMGAVYRARQVSLDRLVAIKLLPLELSVEDDFAERFRREAHAMAKLSHPNIVAVHDHGETEEGHFHIIMEFVEGSDLQKAITERRLGLPETFNVVRQVCDALEYAHGEGFVHRDVKPGNVLLDPQRNAKVSDFGVARLCDEAEPEVMRTVTGGVLGTPAYVAPEQFKGDPGVDHRADIYSLGVMLYELLTGDVPRGAFDPPSKKASVGRHVDEVVDRALQTEPDRRYQSAGEMRDDLEPGIWKRVWKPLAIAAVLTAAAIPLFAILGPEESRDNDRLSASFSPFEPYVNSLGMRFVPSAIPDLLPSVYETRLREFRTFAEEENWDMSGLVYYQRHRKPVAGYNYLRPPYFEATDEQPVTCVNAIDAEGFCAWLTKNERAAERIPEGWFYRLPTNDEWERLADESGYPLGQNPRENRDPGNLPGEEMRGTQFPFLDGRTDAYRQPSPVGSFPAAKTGLHDLVGNVSEWTASPGYGDPELRVVLGSSWRTVPRKLPDDYVEYPPSVRGSAAGFRVVLTRTPLQQP